MVKIRATLEERTFITLEMPKGVAIWLKNYLQNSLVEEESHTDTDNREDIWEALNSVLRK